MPAARRSRTTVTAARRDANVALRISATTRDLIDAAAATVGKSRTDFMVESAAQRATDVLLDQRIFVLDKADHDAFMRVLRDPPPANAALRALMKKKAPWEG